ncbi:hypothetical protein OS493_017788 [Desmophyllum pertusum]|uniref:PH domain-containing protein n=1 Tax=Desmophyllum pertusum TaxID=174260 RepID=A0A9X0CXL7_9CNID|nr:hypothetical protein OS493_017788 [Desmophyllum pertusum]
MSGSVLVMADCNYGVFEAGDIIKYGYMMIKRPPTSTKVRIKAWQSKFFVLRDKTHNSTQRLEYYKDETAFGFQKSVEHSFCLDSIVYIGETHSSKNHCFPIMVVCSKQGAFTLACDTEKAMKDWLLVLNRVAVKIMSRCVSRQTQDNSNNNSNRLFCHHKTDSSLRNEQHQGDYILCVTEGEVVLQSAVDRSQTVVTWSVGHLRAFRSEPAASAGVKDMQLLTLNVGRRSSTGEGIFQFFTKHGETIADEIRHQSKHAFKSAEQKRDAFRKTSTSGSESKSPPSAPASSRRRPTRTMTAPSERSASVLKKDTGVLMENARKRAVTDPFPVQRIEENVSAQQDNRAVVGSEQDGSVSSNDLRPRSVTESSIEKAGDDEVFVSRRTYSEIDLTDGITEESEVSAYIDLVSDESMEPIHISDPVSSRKTSTDSFTSSCSLGSEEGSMRSNSSLPRTFPGAQLIPEENEMDSEGYIKCEVLQTGPAENSIDGNGNVVDYFVSERNGTDNRVCEISGGQSLLSCPVDTTTASSLDICPTGGRVNRKMRENLFAQIKDPNCGNFPPKPKLEKEHALKTENVSPPKSRTEDDAPRFAADPRNEADSRQALLDKLKDPESSKRMFEQIIAQMEKPQQNDVNELFPAVRHKRNSIGAVSLETVRDAKQKSMSLTGAGKEVILLTRNTL